MEKDLPETLAILWEDYNARQVYPASRRVVRDALYLGASLVLAALLTHPDDGEGDPDLAAGERLRVFEREVRAYFDLPAGALSERVALSGKPEPVTGG